MIAASRATWIPEGRSAPIVLERGGESYFLVAATAMLVVAGLLMVHNTSYFYAQERFGDAWLFTRKQALSIGLGLALLFAARLVPTRVWRRVVYPMLAILVVALVLVLVPHVGLVRGGARRWLPAGPLTFQPSELAKLIVVFYLSHSLAKKGERVAELWMGFVPHLVIVGLVAGLVLLEPDFGTTVLIAGVLFVMLVSSGASWLHLGATGAVAVTGFVAIAISAPYRMKRILAFVDPWADPQGIGFQLVQSLVAFGSGGLWGVGLGAGRQKMFYLPGAHTDFIFSVIGEELGLLGALGVIGAFAMFATAGFRLAWRHHDAFAANLALGITSLITLQAALNMAVAVGVLPTKGLALPFLSYGGSALMMTLAEVGILLGVAREARMGLVLPGPELSAAGLTDRGGRIYVPGRGGAFRLAAES